MAFDRCYVFSEYFTFFMQYMGLCFQLTHFGFNDGVLHIFNTIISEI